VLGISKQTSESVTPPSYDLTDYRSALNGHRKVEQISMSAISTSDHHQTLWYSEMSPGEKNAFWAYVGGWILDGMDVQMSCSASPLRRL
jgi:hypothetical protein